MKDRRGGIFLHLTSLPGPCGIGDLGPTAYGFADFLVAAGQRLWQVLPLTPTTLKCGSSPYTSPSAFAGNPLLISPEHMARDGFLAPSDLDGLDQGMGTQDVTDYVSATQAKSRLLDRAHERFREQGIRREEFQRFCQAHAFWLEDHALYTALKERFEDQNWSEWPVELRDRHHEALRDWRVQLQTHIEKEMLTQFIFFDQWHALKAYCNQRGIQILGDAPIYVSLESSDVWAHPDIFRLDGARLPTHVAGVPPDYFSSTGQLWGNPLYDWEALAQRGFDWWVRRIGHYLGLFDMVRLDHFRGFLGYWEIPFGEKAAVNGCWRTAPGGDFFATLHGRFPHLPIIAEDLGTITADVREFMTRQGYPGMNVLLFAFMGDVATSPHAPHNYIRHSVTYTGTHDNNTVRGWLRREAQPHEKENLARYLGYPVQESTVTSGLVRMALMSVANLAIIPMQDLLGLNEEARMNTPSISMGNWRYRLKGQHITKELIQGLRELTILFGRA